jgi:hypothetical protein
MYKPIISAFIFLVYITSCNSFDKEEGNVYRKILNIKIDSISFIKIEKKRAEALKKGFLETESDDYVPVTIYYKDREVTGEIRLKGDRLDHIETKKWSFRIKLDSTFMIDGMKRFSIQRPETRSNLDEWVFHQALINENILTTQYSFCEVIINGENKGTYAIEEHFDKNLLEKQNRREGPILKFGEEGFWKSQLIMEETNKDPKHFVPVFEAAPIEAFQDGHTLKNAELKKLYLNAREKLDSFRYNTGKLSALVDIDIFAKTYVLIDLFQAYHALRWHNLRFYYNPITGLIEPIIYDSYTSDGIYKWFGKNKLGDNRDKNNTLYYREEFLLFQLFNDPDFRILYKHYLNNYSSPSYLDNLIGKITPELNEISSTYSALKYDFSMVSERAKELSEGLDNYKVRNYLPFKYEAFIPNYQPCTIENPIEKISLAAFPQAETKGNNIVVYNYHCHDLYLIGSATKKKEPQAFFEKPIIIPSTFITELPPKSHLLELDRKHDWIFYKLNLNDKKVYKLKVSDWPVNVKPSKNLKVPPIPKNFLVESKDTNFIKSGNIKISALYSYEDNKPLVVKNGTNIEFMGSGGLLLKSPLIIKGTKEKPVKIYSYSSENQGLAIMNSKRTSHIEWANIEGLLPVTNGGKVATGALTFYNSSVKINNCRFENIRCEDALNLVFCDSSIIQNTKFINCTSDAIDVDFSNVTLTNSEIVNIGGDGIDGSGGNIIIDNLDLQDITDKAISLGEGCTGTIEHVKVSKSKIGIAIKEGVKANLNKIDIKESDYGILVYRKKEIASYADVEINYLDCDLDNCLDTEPFHRVMLDKKVIASNKPESHFLNLLY